LSKARSRALSGIGLLAAAAYLSGLAAGAPWLCLVAKPVPVACLAAWTARQRGRYPRLIALGLLVSLTGDLAIEWRFVAGLGLFLVAHLVYVAAFLEGRPALRPLRALPVLAAMALAYRAVASGLGSLRGAVMIYLIALGTMVWRAAGRVGRAGPATVREWSALLGAVAFAASDSLLALDRFRAPLAGARYAVILLYWAGQLGIALSAASDPAGRASDR
jgi:alkenylglycerophosphocholine hydrolase